MHKKLVILFGGPSSEREVSFDTKDFFYNFYAELNPTLVEWTTDFNFIIKNNKLDLDNFLKYLVENNFAVLIASHGEFVEDGYIQKKFESKGIPFTGSDSKSCELAMDKTRSQEAVKNIVNIIPTYNTPNNLNFPFIAKPNALGSSVGIYLIENEKALDKAMGAFNDGYIFQPYIKGREISLGSVRAANGFLKLYPTEIISKNAIFDYEAKYTKGKSKEITPADMDKELTKKIIKITNKIHNILGLGYYSRSDFILTNDDEIYYLETNSLPGMTKTSLLPQQLEYTNNFKPFKKGLIENLINKNSRL